MNELISVIVPIYNVEAYLNQCVESIVHQTYTSLEIILVNDGSHDGCDKLCKEWVKRDSRIKYFFKENGGVCSARNLGLDNATGDYIAFVDADDYIAPNMYEYLHSLIVSGEADLAICGRTRVISGKNETYPDMGLQYFYDGKVDMKMLSCQFDLNISVNKLYKKMIFDNLRFPLGMTYAEDLFIVPDILKATSKIIYTSKGLYYYIERKDSASFNLNEHKLKNDIAAKQRLYDYLQSTGSDVTIAFDWLFAAYVKFFYESKPLTKRIASWVAYVFFYFRHISICGKQVKTLVFLLAPYIYWLKKYA